MTDLPLLPQPVRTRVVELASEALSRLPAEQVPAPLKRVAAFSPARRPRLAGAQIAGALETDDAFRDRVATAVEAVTGDLARALDDGRVPAAADPVEVAAVAYCLRRPGWEEVVRAAAGTVEAEQRAVGSRASEDEVERLRRRTADLEAEVQQLRTRSREQLQRVKGDHADAKRRLGEARTRLRETQAASDSREAAASAELGAARRATSAAEVEVRRLRSRVSELETELASARRTERASRVGESVRARLLLDTLLNAAQGLQRELALPAVDRLPADSVAGAEAEGGVRLSTGRGSLPAGDPGLLEELLRMPRAHLVVDGYNVTKTAWPEGALDRQRDRLLSGTAALQSRTGAEITVVFDAAEADAREGRPLVNPPRGVRVRFSPSGVIADDVIRDLVAAEPVGRVVVVATSDQALARDVVSAGFHVVAAESIASLITGGRT
jgi:predicted RNA-binding protein with PIN domain